MSFKLAQDGVIELKGAVLAGDAEPLLQLILDNPDVSVDWRGCESAHAAIVQVLVVSEVTLIGPPKGLFLRQFVEPAMNAR